MRKAEGDITSGVPYGDVVWSPLFEVESSSDGADGVLKLPLRVPVEQRRLPDVHVPQENHLDVGLLHLGHLGHDDVAGSDGSHTPSVNRSRGSCNALCGGGNQSAELAGETNVKVVAHPSAERHFVE